jgi:hypothetical protein
VVQVDAGEPTVVVPVAHALQRLLDARAPGPDLPRGQVGQDVGVALAAGERLQDEAGGLDPGQRRQDRRQLHQRAFQEFFQPLPFPGAVVHELEPGAGQVAQRPDLGRGHERGAQQAHLGQPGDPLRVQPVGLGPAGQLPGVGGVHQLDAQPCGLQHVVVG